MKNLLYLLVLFSLFSCKKKDVDIITVDTVPEEYENWNILKSPVDRSIEGIWGDYDKTLLISTRYNVFRSIDQGKNWQSVFKSQSAVFGIVQYRDTLFTMHAMATGGYGDFLINPIYYSFDDGISWQEYRKYNPFFDPAKFHVSEEARNLLRIGQVTNSDGTIFKIYRDFLDDPIREQGRFETPGVITSNGRRIDLPQLHQLSSLYLDSKERLYITGSDAVCGQDNKFAFCNSVGGRGVVYVSKNALPR